MNNLHIFISESDACIATSPEDAIRLVYEVVGEEHMYDCEFVQHPDSEPFTITDVDEPGQPSETRLPADWIAEYGRCYWYGWA